MDNRHQEYREEHAVPDAFPVLEENVVWVSQAILNEKESLCRLSSSLVGSTMEWVSSSIATGYCDPNFIGHCIELAQKALSKDSKTGLWIMFIGKHFLSFLFIPSWFNQREFKKGERRLQARQAHHFPDRQVGSLSLKINLLLFLRNRRRPF